MRFELESTIMRVGIDFGREHLDVDVDDRRIVQVRRSPLADPLDNIAEAVRAALEAPLGFPPLRRALTPSDHVTIAIDETLPRLGELLPPVLEHIASAGVQPEAITLLFAATTPNQDWLEQLPEAFEEVRTEIHDASDRRHLSYLATTKRGRRIYLNRTAVDADQLIVMSRRGYDPMFGYSGGLTTLFPRLSDDETRQEYSRHPSLEIPGQKPRPVQIQAAEVAWLLGAPFFVQVIEGSQDQLVHMIGGIADTSSEAERLLNERWRVEVDQAADTVIASISGDPSGQGFQDLAQALDCAARVVKPGGRIVLLTQAKLTLGPGGEILRQAGDPEQALEQLREQPLPDLGPAFQWASAAQQASIYLLSATEPDVAEELFTTPLESASQVQRLLQQEGTCLFLPDAHRLLAVIA